MKVSWNQVSFFAVSSFAAWMQVLALLEQTPLPQSLQECYETNSYNLSMSQQIGREIQNLCYRQHLYSIYAKMGSPNITESGQNYINSLLRKIFSEVRDAIKREKSRRNKRLPPSYGWRYRQEVRVPGAFPRFARCLNRLNRQSVEPGTNRNTYQTLAVLHSGPALSSAHGGPAFLPWHRIYLLILETACGVPIPYWDSSLDFDMEDPTRSILWTGRYFGNGDGDVTTGPFRNWRTILGSPIIRNIGTGESSLLTKEAIGLVLSRMRLQEISEPVLTPAQRIYSLEGHHNGPHVWVDGWLARPNTAAYDPVFFMHHSMIDAVFEVFRQNQWRRGMNPSRDYPVGPNIPQGHNWYDIIDFQPFFRVLRNADALSNYFSRLVRYERFPSCMNRCNGSPDLICNRVNNVCVSRAGAPPRVPAGAAGTPLSAEGFSARARGPLPAGEKFPASPFRDPRNRPDELASAPAAAEVALSGVQARQSARPAAIPRMKRDTSRLISNTTKHYVENKQSLSSLQRRYKNTFLIDGVVDKKKWVYVPVRVIYERKSNDIIGNVTSYYSANEGVYVNSTTVHKCSASGSGATKVYVATDGLDYIGSYKEYTIVDEHQPISVTMAFVGIKNPDYGDGEVLFSAYDSCGRSCRPFCYINGSSRQKYSACSGAFKISTGKPLMFSLSYESAVQRTMAVDNILNQISSNPPVTFVCDHASQWPWHYHV